MILVAPSEAHREHATTHVEHLVADTCCSHTHNHMLQMLCFCRDNATLFLGVVTHTLGTHARHATAPNTHTYTHKVHAIGAIQDTCHAFKAHYTRYTHHTCCLDLPTNTPSAQNHTHVYIQPRGSPLALQPSPGSVPCKANPLL